MKKQIVNLALMLMSITLFFGCNEVAQVTEEPEIDWSQSYLPLQVGNEWHYRRIFTSQVDGKSDTSYTVFQILEEVTLEGERYMKVLDTDGRFGLTNPYPKVFSEIYDSPKPLNHYIKTRDGISFDIFILKEQRIYRDFSNPDLNSAENEFTISMTDTNHLNDLSFLTGKQQLVYSFNQTHTLTSIYEKGFGCIEASVSLNKFELFYAKVNGREYGEKRE